LLHEHGYTCGLAGKLHLSPCNPDDPTDPMRERRIDDGYSEFHWSHEIEPRWPTNEYHHWLREKGVEFDRTPVEWSEYVTTSVAPEHHQTTWCAQKGINFIEANESYDSPWLFSVNMFDPHFVFDPPEAYLERYLDDLDDIPLPNYESGELDDKPVYQRQHHRGDVVGSHPYPEMFETDHRLIRAAYWAMCDLIDDQVGRLLDALEETNQREDTIVIFTSDHGDMLGDHGLYLKGPFFYDPAIRVPLVVSWPSEVETMRVSEALVELSDLAPTLLEAADIDRHPGMQTRSLWPLLTGERDIDDGRDDVYCEYYNAMPYHTDPVPAFGTMVRTDEYKIVDMHGIDGGELYDLEADPNETQNRWNDPSYQSVKAEMMERLSRRMADTVDPLPEREVDW
jgi:arylsulfatase A-like enzyme